jgi:hypothetical protein
MNYIPVEVIGAYLALTDAVSSVSDHTKREVVLWIIFGVVLCMTPVYLRNLTKVVRLRQRLASTGAFAVWALALGGRSPSSGAVTSHGWAGSPSSSTRSFSPASV